LAVLSKITDGVEIQVRTKYIPEESNPDAHHYFFAYQITIKNLSDHPVQLLNRHWIIMDQRGRVEEVRGAGVVGKQPELKPRESFEYTSFCPLPTPTGSMRGTYEMIRHTGETFHVDIPEFELIRPGALGLVH
jgi:ApaG protein